MGKKKKSGKILVAVSQVEKENLPLALFLLTLFYP